MFGEFAITLEASTIRPGPVTLVVHNAGHLTHGFEMKIEGGHGSGGDRRKIETRTFRSGETLRVEADLPAGTYEIECFVADHASLGMKTTLTVRSDAPLASPAPGSSVPGTVRIVQFAFVAASIEVVPGGSVTWTNEDPTPHTVTADGGAFDSRQLDPGRRFSIVLDKPGDYAYHCEIHPTMVGTIHVP
jgi:plastocyanin